MLEELRDTKGISYRVLAIDLSESRRAKMKNVYKAISNATPSLSLQSGSETFVVVDIEEGKSIVSEWTDSLGCNGVLEVRSILRILSSYYCDFDYHWQVVGNNSALSLSYVLVRPFGTITSVGVHQSRPLPFTGTQVYDKNISFDFGRCPVRAVLPIAARLLLRRQDVFGGVGDEESLVERIEGFGESEVVKGYEMFEKGEWGKVLFDPWR